MEAFDTADYATFETVQNESQRDTKEVDTTPVAKDINEEETVLAEQEVPWYAQYFTKDVIIVLVVLIALLVAYFYKN